MVLHVRYRSSDGCGWGKVAHVTDLIGIFLKFADASRSRRSWMPMRKIFVSYDPLWHSGLLRVYA